MARFLLFALVSLVLLFALFNLALELAGEAPELGPLVGWHTGRAGLPGATVLGAWALEALALTALFLLVDARGGGGTLVNALSACWIAWVFRGPLLVLTVAGAARPHEPWWNLALRWFVLYTLAGFTLTLAARVAGLRAQPAARAS